MSSDSRVDGTMTFTKRRLIRHVPVAFVCAFAVVAVLNVAAWQNLRGIRNVCQRQDGTRDSLRVLSGQIEAYRKKRHALPRSLSDIPDVYHSWRHPDGPPADEWGTPIIYLPGESDFVLRSLGRDRSLGGIGLDADLEARELYPEIALATFRQFFTEDDPSEVDRRGFTMAGIFAGIIVFASVLNVLSYSDTQDRKLRPISIIGYSLVIVVIAITVGLFLMPVHIPNGH